MAAAPCTSQQLLATPRFTVERRVFARPGAAPLVREFIVHPGAAVILPILPDGRMVLVRQMRRGVESELVELPAGTLDPGEAPIETARRELEEETGFRAGRIEPLAEFFTSPGVMTERMHAFLATELEPVGQSLDEGEQIQVEFFPPGKVRKMLVDGEFRDGKTIATLGLYFLRRPD